MNAAHFLNAASVIHELDLTSRASVAGTDSGEVEVIETTARRRRGPLGATVRSARGSRRHVANDVVPFGVGPPARVSARDHRIAAAGVTLDGVAHRLPNAFTSGTSALLLRAHPNAERGELRFDFEHAEGAAERALIGDQARHDADAAAQADERKNGFAPGHLTVDSGRDAPLAEPAVDVIAREPEEGNIIGICGQARARVPKAR